MDTATKDSATVTFHCETDSIVMHVPGRSIRPGNFHRGRQDVFGMPSSLGFFWGDGESLRRVLLFSFDVVFPLKLLVDVLLRLGSVPDFS